MQLSRARSLSIAVKLRLYQGAASSLYGGWEQEAKGKEVTINTGTSLQTFVLVFKNLCY
jgi:hypothetical protein